MKIKKERTTRYILELTEKEALWLKACMQNPMRDDVDESPKDEEMRGALFAALPPFTLTGEEIY